MPTHHLSSLCAGDGELQVRISLPESIKQGIAGEELVVHLANGSDGLRTRVAIEAALLRLGGADELLPFLEVLGVLVL